MSQAVSAATEAAYVVERVCVVWEQARSTFYDRRGRARCRMQGLTPGKRGPEPLVPDVELPDLIRRDLAASPFVGEGHRKVWGRSRFGQGIRVSRTRMLRLMRENHLLSPYRGRQGQPDPHEGTIVTEAPNLMWGTDGAKVFTLEDGWVWVFAAVEHWNAECMGWRARRVSNPRPTDSKTEPLSFLNSSI